MCNAGNLSSLITDNALVDAGIGQWDSVDAKRVESILCSEMVLMWRMDRSVVEEPLMARLGGRVDPTFEDRRHALDDLLIFHRLDQLRSSFGWDGELWKIYTTSKMYAPEIW